MMVESTRMQIQRVTNIVQTQSMRQLGVKQTHDMAPGREAAGLLVHTRGSRQPGDQMRCNPVAKLSKNGEFEAAWLSLVFFFFIPAVWQGSTSQPSFFFQAMGRL